MAFLSHKQKKIGKNQMMSGRLGFIKNEISTFKQF